MYVSQIPNAFYVGSKRNLTFLSPNFVHTYPLPFAILPSKSSGRCQSSNIVNGHGLVVWLSKAESSCNTYYIYSTAASLLSLSLPPVAPPRAQFLHQNKQQPMNLEGLWVALTAVRILMQRTSRNAVSELDADETVAYTGDVRTIRIAQALVSVKWNRWGN